MNYLRNLRMKFSKREKILLTTTLILGAMLIFFSLNSDKESLYVYSIFFFWCSFILYSLMNVYNRVIPLMFLIAFFNFLIGRSLLISLGVYEEPYSFTLAESIKGQKIVLFSIVVVYLSYVLFEKIIVSEFHLKCKMSPNESKRIRIRRVAKFMFYFTYPLLIISILALVRYVNINGYASMYQDFTPKVPIMIKKTGDIAPFAFLIFLGTMPAKREIFFPLIFWLIYLTITLATGARFDFVIGIMSLFTYFLIRNVVERGEKLWVTKRFVVYSSFIGFVLLIGMSVYNDTRFGYQPDSKPIYDHFTKFFYDQGININNNKRIFKYEDKLNDNVKYSFKSTVSFYERNIRGRIKGDDYYNGNSVERALYSNSLADTLSYYVLGEDKYLSGHGVGTSYIAEVFYDFGYFGLIVVNGLYAFILLTINRLLVSNQVNYGFVFVYLFNLFSAFLKIPRSAADTFILKTIDPMLWITILLVLILEKTITHLKMKNRKKVLYD